MISTKGSGNLDQAAQSFLDMESALEELLNQAYEEGKEVGYNEGYDAGQATNE